jgi:hypothetical protein
MSEHIYLQQDCWTMNEVMMKQIYAWLAPGIPMGRILNRETLNVPTGT